MAPLTLVTGATGFIGAHCLQELVSKTDHRLRLVVRNVEKTDTIKENFGEELSSGRIEFVEVKDMLAPKAFDGKLEGVDYIVHLASPFVYHAENNRKDIIEPAVTLVNSVLEAADAVPSVKRVVVTSSFASIVNPLFPGQGVKRPHTYTEADHQPITQAWLAQAYTPLAYVASKTLAEKAVWDHIEKKKPHYDAVTFHPPYVYGPVIHSVKSADKLNESSTPVYKLLDSKSVPKSDFPPFIDVRDVAAFHVAAITNPKASNQRYLISGGNLSWQSFVDRVHAADSGFDEATKARVPKGTPGKNDLPKVLAELDASKAEQDFGWTQWRDANQCLADALRSIVELEKKWNA